MHDREPSGIGGWLFVLVFGLLILGPLLALGQTYAAFPAGDEVAEYAEPIKTFVWTTTLVTLALSIAAGLLLVFRRTKSTVSIVVALLWIIGPLATLVSLAGLNSLVDEDMVSAGEITGRFVGACIAALIWTAYLRKSKRVANTFDVRADSQSIVATNSPPLQRPVAATAPITLPIASNEDHEDSDIEADDRIYEAIAVEIEERRMDQGLWTRSFGEADGDENRTRALYIKARFQRLKAAQLARKRAAKTAEEQRIREELAAKRCTEEQVLSRLTVQERILSGKLDSELKRLNDSGVTTKFLLACQKSDLGAVAEMLTVEPFLAAATDREGNTGLHIAVQMGHVQVVEKLVEGGANVHARNQYTSPLEYAVASDLKRITPTLLRVADSQAKMAAAVTARLRGMGIGDGSAPLQ